MQSPMCYESDIHFICVGSISTILYYTIRYYTILHYIRYCYSITIKSRQLCWLRGPSKKGSPPIRPYFLGKTTSPKSTMDWSSQHSSGRSSVGVIDKLEAVNKYSSLDLVLFDSNIHSKTISISFVPEFPGPDPPDGLRIVRLRGPKGISFSMAMIHPAIV